MQLFKRLGKQLSVLALMSYSIFSASSASAETKSIFVNTDVVLSTNFIKNQFPGATQVDVLQLGGVINIDNPLLRTLRIKSTDFYDPFANSGYYNNRNVGGSNFLTARVGVEITGIFNAKPTNPPLRLDLDPSGSNPPTLPRGSSSAYGGTCPDELCFVLHYGYTQILDPGNGPLNAAFDRSLIQLQDPRDSSIVNIIQFPMAAPRVAESPVGAANSRLATTRLSQNLLAPEYLVVYSEFTDPFEPDVVVASWSEFAVTPGQMQILSFANGTSNDGTIISNTRVLKTSTLIPLEQLNAVLLPPTLPAFQALPDANQALLPGQVTADSIIQAPTIDASVIDTSSIEAY